MSHNSHINSQNCGGQYSAPPGLPEDYFPWGGGWEIIQNINQDCSFYPHKNNPYYHHPSMKPQTIFLCPYCTPSLIYAPYGFSHHMHIPSFVYLYFLPHSCLPSYILPNLLPPDWCPHFSSRITNQRINRAVSSPRYPLRSHSLVFSKNNAYFLWIESLFK